MIVDVKPSVSGFSAELRINDKGLNMFMSDHFGKVLLLHASVEREWTNGLSHFPGIARARKNVLSDILFVADARATFSMT